MPKTLLNPPSPKGLRASQASQILPKLFVLLPCYNEEEVLPKTYEVLSKKLGALMERGSIAADSRMVFVDDGSKDRTWAVLKSLVAHAESSANDLDSRAGDKLESSPSSLLPPPH
ncbi:glycosyltransferase [Helicobacter sp. CLO-3]|uniref:glycosyltransferase n=1 Tax=Helicobacter sp. CLO-3 TaxID=211 RepID=UPI000A921500|nr:glycosyltransferase [Helicobacter sp. CLO-3]